MPPVLAGTGGGVFTSKATTPKFYLHQHKREETEKSLLMGVCKEPYCRFISFVDPQPDGCWHWTGARNLKGYGHFKADGFLYAHRWSYMYHKGPIPNGLEIDHICNVRHCVNPDHLQALSHAENVRRAYPDGISSRSNCRGSVCLSGHPLNEENLRIHGKRRVCAACCRERERQRYYKWKLAREMAVTSNQEPGSAMTLNSKEHIDIMAQFEKDVKNSHSYSLRFDKETQDQWARGHIYQHGETNNLFLIYRMGYAFGRCVYLNS